MGDVQLFEQGRYGQGPGDSLVNFPLPWLDYASSVMPNSLSLVLRWAEYIWLQNGTYKEACRRTARYFITDLMYKEIDDAGAKELRELLEEDLKVKQLLALLGDAFLCYGNVFATLAMPFKRFLICQCGFAVPLEEAHKSRLYTWKDYEFHKAKDGGCPACGALHADKPWKIRDEQDRDPSKLQILQRSPHEMEIGFNPYNGAKQYFWNLPVVLTTGLERGDFLILKETPVEVIEACKQGSKRLQLDSDLVFHHAEPGPDGLYMGGWGLPRVIMNYRLAYHYQVLNRYDMAIAMDYINGMRVISPEQNSQGEGAGDPLVSLGGSMFNRAVSGMVSKHRKDPATWHISPTPLKYQLFGGEGQQLSPKDLLQYKLNEWLDATGIPAELYHGNLSIQAAPIALRVFENSWPEVQALYNNFLSWIGNYMIQVLKVPEFKAKMMPPRLADDLERRQVMLQLMSGNQVSPQTAMQAFGINDPREEIRRAFEWQAMAAEEEKAFQDKMMKLEETDQVVQGMAQRAAQQGAPMGAPGAPMPGGAPAPMDPTAMGGGGGTGGMQVNQDALSSPESMMGEADRLAQQIIQMGDGAERRRAIRDLKKVNEVLHSLVKTRIESYEQDAARQGVSMLRSGQ